MKFKTVKQAKKYLKEWQSRLFLEGWTIEVMLVKQKEIPDEQGHIEFSQENKCAVIKIAMAKHTGDFIQKICAEKVLVHELLHCKYNLLKKDDTYESLYLDIAQHSLLEQMAKSLIMVKYNVSFKWFSRV